MIFPRFHLAIAVRDLGSTREFYGGLLGCREGRSAATWVDFDFYGHQISAHVAPNHRGVMHHDPVDRQQVPIPHFGLILAWDDWQLLADRLRTRGVDFVIEPYLRFRGEVGEQATLFLSDPSGNALEFKSFRDETRIFAR